MRYRAGFALVLACSLAGCGASEPPAGPSMPRGPAWAEARSELEKLRQAYAPATGTMRVRVRFSAGGDLEVAGRGAVARRPPEDLRMILLGPGGMTAFDLLVRADAWRVSIPSRDRVLEGNLSEASPRGLPVTFLRWWLLRPLSGRLLSYADLEDGRVFVLRQDDATIRVQRRGEGLVMDRKGPSGRERMSVSGPGCGRAEYQHVDAKVQARVECEAVISGDVDPSMFRLELDNPTARRRTPAP